MKKKLLKFTFWALFFSPLYAEGYWANPFAHQELPPGLFFEAYTQNFFSSANYTSAGGEYQALERNGRFYASRNRLTGAYTLPSSVQLRTSLDLTAASISLDSYSENAVNFSGVELGLVYPFLHSSSHRLLWDVRGLVRLDTVEGARREPLGHSGVHYLQSSLQYEKIWHKFGLYTEQGVFVPAEGLAGLWIWNLGARLYFSKLTLSGGVEGFSTVIDDTDPAGRSGVFTVANGGSFAFHTVNPQRMAFRAAAEVALSDNWSVPMSVLKTFNGQNSAEGFELTAGVRFRPGAASKKPERTQRLRPVREQDFEVERPRPNTPPPRYGEDGELLQDSQEFMEDRFRERRRGR